MPSSRSPPPRDMLSRSRSHRSPHHPPRRRSSSPQSPSPSRSPSRSESKRASSPHRHPHRRDDDGRRRHHEREHADETRTKGRERLDIEEKNGRRDERPRARRSRSRSRSRERRRSAEGVKRDERSTDRRRDRDRDGHRDRPSREDRHRHGSRDTDEHAHRKDRRRRRSHSREGHRSHRHHRRHSASASRSRSRSPKRPRRHHSPSTHKHTPPPTVIPRNRAPLPPQAQAFTHTIDPSAPAPEAAVEKQTPNFLPTGLLAAASNTLTVHTSSHPSSSSARPGGGSSIGAGGGGGGETKQIVLKYHEPPEARLPPALPETRLYCFLTPSTTAASSTAPAERGLDGAKGGVPQKEATIDEKSSIPNLGTRSCWLVGRQREVVDILTENSSVSGQHAVLQWRYRPPTTGSKHDGGKGKGSKGEVRLYVLDLESANGTWLNGERIESGRYVQVLGGDVLKWAVGSQREWVVVRG